MERLQRGQEPRLSHSSLEHTLQKVCPHGINAAPFFLPMHTQHTESFPKTFSSFSFSFSAVAASPPSVSSSSLISDTLHGALTPPPSSWGTLSCLSAASAAARFIPEPEPAGPTHSGAATRPGSVSCCCSCSPWLTLNASERNPQEAPQHPMPMNPNRSFKLRLLRVPPSTPSICSLNNPRMVLLASLWVRSDSCNATPSWLISNQKKSYELKKWWGTRVVVG